MTTMTGELTVPPDDLEVAVLQLRRQARDQKRFSRSASAWMVAHHRTCDPKDLDRMSPADDFESSALCESLGEGDQ
jgi:hypothetical protein